MSTQVWLITGSSRGLGRSLAEAVLAAGHKLLATARNLKQLSDLVDRHGDNIRAVALDVTDERAAVRAVQAAVDTFGRLDVLVNNAGYGNLASIEDTASEDFRAQVETNLFGVVNLTRAAIPVMRNQGSGRMFQFASIGGRVGPVGRGAYAAAKWGVEGFSEVLAKEVGPLGIKVTIIEPGGFRTDFAGSSQVIRAENPVYASTVGAAAKFQREFDGSQPGDPKKAAAVILHIASVDEPPLRLLLGSDAVRAAEGAERARSDADRRWRHLSESTDFAETAKPPSRQTPVSEAAPDSPTRASTNPARQSSRPEGAMDKKAQTWLITGASSGLGYALAEYVLERGDRVVLAARSMNSMSALAARYPKTALAVGLDVTQSQQRIAAVQQAEVRFGGIDVLVNNAGIDFVGSIEEQDEEDYRALFEVNFFGAVAMLRLVLPGMRRRKSGTIVNMSSMDGLASLPANGYYSSSKFALEGLTEALWQEIEPIGLRAILVEPGSFRTGIEQRTRFSGRPIDAYESTSGALRKIMDKVSPEMFPGDPVRAAQVIYEVVSSDRPRHWVILGSDAHRRIGAKLDMLHAEYQAGKEMAFSTDYPGSGQAIL
jgi:NAD(P)-dependent dehydrogenase (short-subunit alcohol dehydrogenase family)